jgi:hypothetical protein
MLWPVCGRENDTPDMLVIVVLEKPKAGLDILSISDAWLQPCRFRYSACMA